MRFHPESWMLDEIERRKTLWRSLFLGRRLERIPLDIRVVPDATATVREQMKDGDVQLKTALEMVRASWSLGDKSDWIPAMRPDVGCSCLASAYGAEYFWGENPDQTPGILEPILKDLEHDVAYLADPDPYIDGWLPEGLDRIRKFAEAGDGVVPVSLLDAAGGLNVAADLVGLSELLTALYTAPEAVHLLLRNIQRLFLATIDAGIRAAGGEEYITTTDFPDFWFPEGFKGHVSDDISANFGPEMYEEFSAPYHSLVHMKYGNGGLHNCGPNPCHEAYVARADSPVSLDLSDAFSHADLPVLSSSLKGRGFVYLTFDRLLNPRLEPVTWYDSIMESCAPDLIVVPVVTVGDVEAAASLHDRLDPIAREYAARTRWGWWRRESSSPQPE